MMATRTAKIAIVLISKKKLYKCSTLSCTFFWRCFATRQRETSQLHILYRKCRMCSPQFLLLVSLVAFFFHCRQNFSFCHRQFSCFSSDEIRLFCSVSNALPLSLLSTPVKTKKCSQTRFCCCFFSLRPSVAFGLLYLLIELFHIGIPVVRTEHLRSRYFQIFSDAQITKFSYSQCSAARQTFHCPLFSRKIAQIERFALGAAILNECQNYLGGRGWFGRKREKQGDCNNITAARVHGARCTSNAGV